MLFLIAQVQPSPTVPTVSEPDLLAQRHQKLPHVVSAAAFQQDPLVTNFSGKNLETQEEPTPESRTASTSSGISEVQVPIGNATIIANDEPFWLWLINWILAMFMNRLPW